MGGALENVVLSLEIAAGACWALENAVPSLEIAARACSEPHVRSKSQLGPVPEPTRLGPLAADMFLYVVQLYSYTIHTHMMPVVICLSHAILEQTRILRIV